MKELFKKNKTAILISTIGILVLLNIISYTKLWTNLDTYFDSKVFNDIATPIATIIAVIIYYRTLKQIENQNKITISNSFRPHFESRIRDLINQREENLCQVFPDIGIEKDYLTFKDCITEILKQLKKIDTNEDFQSDFQNYRAGGDLKIEYIKTRSYSNRLLFIYQFSLGFSPLNFFMNEASNLLEEIKLSQNLIELDKQFYYHKLNHEIFSQYDMFVQLLKSTPFSNIELPDIYSRREESLKFKPIGESSLTENFKIIKHYLVN